MEMQEKRKSVLPSLKLVVIAAIAGTIAGAAGVYMNLMGSGNGSDAVVAEIDCSGAAVRAAAAKPFAKGEVAAFALSDEPKPLKLGAFNGPDDKTINLDTLAGHMRLVNLWATWCVPCREEMPALDRLQKDMGSDLFEVVAINIDTGDVEKPKAFLAETGVASLAFYRDATMGSFNTLKKQGLAFGLPVTVLVDEKGCMLGSMNGPAKWDSPDAKAMLAAALGPSAGS